MLRPPPHDSEAEQAVLGSIFVNGDTYHRVSPFLLEEHFFEPEHGRLYAAAGKLINAGRKATPITVKEYAQDPSYLGQLSLAAVSPSVAEDIAKVVRDLAIRRDLVRIGESLAARAQTASLDETSTQLIEATEADLAGLAERGLQIRQISLMQAVTDAVDVVAQAYKRDSGLVGLSTGFADLDAKLGGLVPSELVILAGRPSMGKTALGTNIAFNAARTGTAVGFFTVEMSAQQVALRLLGDVSRISAHRMRQGRICEEEFDTIIIAAQDVAELPMRFDETGGISVAQVCARARRWKRQHNIGLLVVDYLQLMSGTGRRRDRVQEVSEITVGLKSLAKELEIPVLALSQLSRQVENRDDKRPQLSDLRESGSIEQDADVVMFIYREEYYLARTEPKEGTEAYYNWQGKMTSCANKAEILIAKQRHGPIGTVELQFNAELTRFSNLARPHMLGEVA